VTFIKAEEKI